MYATGRGLTSLGLPLGRTDDGQIARVFEEIDRAFGGLDFVVHGAAFAPPHELSNPFTQTTREGFKMALDISAYSLIALSRGALPLMERKGGGSILTLTYLGSERVFPNYNVMVWRRPPSESTVATWRRPRPEEHPRERDLPGPIRTLASRRLRFSASRDLPAIARRSGSP